MAQSPSMSGGWKRTPSGVGTWQSRAFQLLAEAELRRQPPRHLGGPAIAVEMERVRELEVGGFARTRGPATTRCMRGCSPSQRISTDGWNSGWTPSKSDASPSLVSGSRASRSVWQSAQNCCGVGTISCGPSCSVWQSTQRPGRVAERIGDSELDPAQDAEVRPRLRRAGRASAWSWMLVWQAVQAVSAPRRRRRRGRPGNCWRARHGRATGCR